MNRIAMTYGHRFARRLFLEKFHGEDAKLILEVEENLVSDALFKISKEKIADRKQLVCKIRNHIFEKIKFMGLEDDKEMELKTLVESMPDETILPTVE